MFIGDKFYCSFDKRIYILSHVERNIATFYAEEDNSITFNVHVSSLHVFGFERIY